MYHFTDGGLRNVWLTNGYEIKQTKYGQAVAFQDIDGLTKAICMAFIRKKSKLTGVEFRYLRSAMLMSQAAIGKALGRTEQAVAIWEKSGKVPKFADTLMRVIYAAHADGNERVKNIIHAINDTERTIHLVMQDTPRGWMSEEKDEDELCAA
jgi:DNA-binding transcriptional regulator YiaG